jgi:hypothetical protein
MGSDLRGGCTGDIRHAGGGIEEVDKEDEMNELNSIISQVSESIAQHTEEFAAAFVKRTGLDPTQIKMVSSIRGYRHEVWFEPFPTLTDIEKYRQRAEIAEAEIARLEQRNEYLEEIQHDIDSWCRAYPLKIANEPTEQEWEIAHAVMKEHGMNLSQFAVSAMRRITTGISEIIAGRD